MSLVRLADLGTYTLAVYRDSVLMTAQDMTDSGTEFIRFTGGPTSIYSFYTTDHDAHVYQLRVIPGFALTNQAPRATDLDWCSDFGGSNSTLAPDWDGGTTPPEYADAPTTEYLPDYAFGAATWTWAGMLIDYTVQGVDDLSLGFELYIDTNADGAWIDAATQGTVAVGVYHTDGSGPLTAGELLALSMTLDVVGGTITYTAVSDFSAPYLVRVTPAYDTTGMSVRVNNIVFDDGYFDDGYMGIDWSGTTPPVAPPITPTGQFFPNPAAFYGTDAWTWAGVNIGGFEGEVFQSITFNLEVQAAVPPDAVSFNCECDDDYPRKTLEEMRNFLMIRLGFAAQLASPLPGMPELLNSFLVDAQEQLHKQYKVFRLERFFAWPMLTGVRFYDLLENEDECTKKLDPRMVTWVGISQGDDFWRPLICGIKPEYYYAQVTGWPQYYEIRQCIEVWPAPSDDTWKLRIKGYFDLMPLVEDEDYSTIDYEAIQLFALANAKAHYGQPDAANYAAQYRSYLGRVTAGSHHTRRYVPSNDMGFISPLPLLTGYPGDP